MSHHHLKVYVLQIGQSVPINRFWLTGEITKRHWFAATQNEERKKRHFKTLNQTQDFPLISLFLRYQSGRLVCDCEHTIIIWFELNWIDHFLRALLCVPMFYLISVFCSCSFSFHILWCFVWYLKFKMKNGMFWDDIKTKWMSKKPHTHKIGGAVDDVLWLQLTFCVRKMLLTTKPITNNSFVILYEVYDMSLPNRFCGGKTIQQTNKYILLFCCCCMLLDWCKIVFIIGI